MSILDAPCKVNLTLDVFPPRPDGFHDLDSVVARYLPADVLRVEVAQDLVEPRIALSCSDPHLPTNEGNLAHRAAAAFLERFCPEVPVAIRVALEKRLPHQAGLGGGSSDAAAVLSALRDQLCPALPDADLRELAATLGSDVPLFLHDGPVRMRGRGDAVEPLGVPLPDLYGVLVKPAVGVPTGPAYRLLDALPDRQPGSATGRLLDVLRSDVPGIDAIGAAMGNDFEAAVLPAFPAVAEAHRAVADAGAVRALLCGSGSCVFGLARDCEHAGALTKALCGQFPWVHLAEPYTARPTGVSA
ncbi:MAG TPA: 4-(cytidine 5'-diphospho)-2-C-methyl-D-erythritol kinase [Armatimonadaceae bacterium]|nr:4-(cytidine 5'-diphospho)-2-C-methyl-D-erythritol kinase [Armatimonadaceae bacterium]